MNKLFDMYCATCDKVTEEFCKLDEEAPCSCCGLVLVRSWTATTSSTGNNFVVRGYNAANLYSGNGK